MNLARAVTLLSKLHIKHRDLGVSTPFILNHNQRLAVQAMAEQYELEGYIRVCILKARRLGMSSLIDALLMVYAMAYAAAHCEIVSHEFKTSELGLFRVPHDLAEELNTRFKIADVRARRIYFHHDAGDSLMDIATAGSVGSGRGLTLNALHLSEAANYPPISGSFLALLPAVSKGPNTMIAVESTANGKVADGEAFYEFWKSACAPRNTPRWNGYVPIFLDWLHDPACVRPEDEADDAPATDLEKELMRKPFFATRAQIAWMRRTLKAECAGEETKFLQEFPHEAMVAFQSTGDPAFPREEMIYAERTKREPRYTGRIARRDHAPYFEPTRSGPLFIWEKPLPQCYYYLGADAAAGYETGDFAAIAVYNGTTGTQACRFSAHASPEELAEQCDLLGRWYNNAMVNIELTGNLGRWAQKRLRDNFTYPNLYRWRGKDDKLNPNRGRSNAAGWETNNATRGLLREAFREKLRMGIHDLPGGLEVYDAELVSQMESATMQNTAKWEVIRGHDDILIAWMLAVVTCAQYPPPNILSYRANYMTRQETGYRSNIAAALHQTPQANLENALKRDLDMILRREPRRSMLTAAANPSRFAGGMAHGDTQVLPGT